MQDELVLEICTTLCLYLTRLYCALQMFVKRVYLMLNVHSTVFKKEKSIHNNKKNIKKDLSTNPGSTTCCLFNTNQATYTF